MLDKWWHYIIVLRVMIYEMYGKKWYDIWNVHESALHYYDNPFFFLVSYYNIIHSFCSYPCIFIDRSITCFIRYLLYQFLRAILLVINSISLIIKNRSVKKNAYIAQISRGSWYIYIDRFPSLRGSLFPCTFQFSEGYLRCVGARVGWL